MFGCVSSGNISFERKWENLEIFGLFFSHVFHNVICLFDRTKYETHIVGTLMFI